MGWEKGKHLLLSLFLVSPTQFYLYRAYSFTTLHCSCCKDLDWKVNRTFFMYYLVTPSAESLWCYYTITVPFAFCLLINLSPFITCSQPICAALYSLDVIFVSGQDNEKEPSMCLLYFDYVCSNWILNLQWMVFILVWNGILEFWYVIM